MSVVHFKRHHPPYKMLLHLQTTFICDKGGENKFKGYTQIWSYLFNILLAGRRLPAYDRRLR